MANEPTIAELHSRLVALDEAFEKASHTIIRLFGEQAAFHAALIALIDSHPAPESFLSNLANRYGWLDAQDQGEAHAQGRVAAQGLVLQAAQAAVDALHARKN